jgi:spore germination protein YaaH
MEQDLRGSIEALRGFQGFQEDFEEMYEEGRRVLAEMLRSHPVLPASLAT